MIRVRLHRVRAVPRWVSSLIAWGLTLALTLALAFHALPAHADTLEAIQRRGELVVGVKRDVPLWGWADSRDGVPIGLEPDLAADLAARLRVKLRMVGVLTADRIGAVEQRRVDVLIATLSDTPERRERLNLVLPHYYASGTNVLARRSAGFREWRDLRNRRVCGRRGAFYNRAITVDYDIDIVALYSNSLALEALRDGRCDALLYDDTNIIAMLQDPKWVANFEMPLQTLHITPWSIALHRQERGGRLEQAVSAAIVDWHRSGRILALERQWGIPVSAYANRMNIVWSRLRGQPGYCGEAVGPETPKDCL